MSPSELTRSTAFRIAAIYSGFFLVTVCGIFAALYVLISSEMEHKLKVRVLEIRDAIVAAQDAGGFEALKRLVARNGPTTPDTEDIYLLTDEQGAFVAGNVGLVGRFDGWQDLNWDSLSLIGDAKRGSTTTAAISMWTPVRGGFLLIGAGNGDLVNAQQTLLNAVTWGMLLTVVAALVGGTILGVRTQRRIGTMETALEAVGRGEFATRLPLSRAGDDLDQVALRINRTLDQFQVLFGMVRQVSSDIAHDLKTPLGRIRQRLDVMQRSGTTAEQYREGNNQVLAEIDGVIETFEALLRIAQIEGGSRKARFADVDLREIMLNIVEVYEAVAEDSGDTITANLGPANRAGLRGDKELLTQLFANLIENAIRHCPAGARIEVSLERAPDGHIARIKDNGPGVPEDERTKVFRRLYRLEKSRTTPGSGLGLSMAAAIADLHDAKIELGDNSPGLVVTLRFPASAAA